MILKKYLVQRPTETRRNYNFVRVKKYLLFIAILISGCASVKPYQRIYLNDENMKTGKSRIDKTDYNAETFREGASGGGRGKTTGGCGCN